MVCTSNDIQPTVIFFIHFQKDKFNSQINAQNLASVPGTSLKCNSRTLEHPLKYEIGAPASLIKLKSGNEYLKVEILVLKRNSLRKYCSAFMKMTDLDQKSEKNKEKEISLNVYVFHSSHHLGFCRIIQFSQFALINCKDCVLKLKCYYCCYKDAKLFE